MWLTFYFSPHWTKLLFWIILSGLEWVWSGTWEASDTAWDGNRMDRQETWRWSLGRNGIHDDNSWYQENSVLKSEKLLTFRLYDTDGINKTIDLFKDITTGKWQQNFQLSKAYNDETRQRLEEQDDLMLRGVDEGDLCGYKQTGEWWGGVEDLVKYHCIVIIYLLYKEANRITQLPTYSVFSLAAILKYFLKAIYFFAVIFSPYSYFYRMV